MNLSEVIKELKENGYIITGGMKWRGTMGAIKGMVEVMLYTTEFDETEEEWAEDLQEARN